MCKGQIRVLLFVCISYVGKTKSVLISSGTWRKQRFLLSNFKSHARVDLYIAILLKTSFFRNNVYYVLNWRYVYLRFYMDISAIIQPVGCISKAGRISSHRFFFSRTFSLIWYDIYALTFSRNGILLQALSGSRRARNGRRPEPVIASMVTSVLSSSA